MEIEMETSVKLINWFDEHWYIVKRLLESDAIEGKSIASTTTKMQIERKVFLERWRGDVGNKTADDIVYTAGQRGKRIHHALYTCLNKGKVIYDPWEFSVYKPEDIEKMRADNEFFFALKNQDEMVDLWKMKRFLELVKAKVLHTELTVYSIDDDEAGTLDIALEIEKGKYKVDDDLVLNVPVSGAYIADLKSGKHVGDEAYRQVSVYGKNYTRMGYGNPEGGLVLHTGATTKKGIPGFSAKLKTTEQLEPHYAIYKTLASAWDALNPNAGPKVMQFPSIIEINTGEIK